MAEFLEGKQERLEKAPYWHRTASAFRFATLMVSGVICARLSASPLFRPVEPKFLDQVLTLSGEGGLLWVEDRKGWIEIWERSEALEAAELALEPRLGFLIPSA